jgi:diguanylate cyclase (GGDEF)-like protein
MLYLLQESRWFIDGDGMPSHIVFEGRDISSTVVSWRKIRYLADYDSLTGLTSRAHTLDKLQWEIQQAESNKSCFAIAIADVNEFKLVNDQYGHGVGDIVLRDVAKRIKGSLNDGCIVGRLSGDEFLIIFSNVSTLEEAEEQKEKIKGAFAERMIIDDNDIALSVSIGLALYPENGADDKTLLEYADMHMYLDKEQRGTFSPAGRKYRGGRSVQCDI